MGAATVPRGGSDRFARIVEDHLPGLRSAAIKLCGNASDANDLVQDTLERALLHHQHLLPGSNDWGWLYTILHNLFIDLCRRRRREKLSVPVGDLPAPMDTPSLWHSVTVDQVRTVLGEVEPKFRTVFELHDIEGCSYEEIGRRLDVPYSTIGTRLHRARRRIKELLMLSLTGGAGGGE
jgi:RNA polymerase sigma-70 factor, ECF subfamily